jgi:uroporphyrinogen decarboxylase
MNKKMDGKTRFINSLSYKQVDRPPLFEDGIRDKVLRKWRQEGLGKKENLESNFIFDKREEIEPNLEPIPMPTKWPTTSDGLKKLAKRLDPDDPHRLPEGWMEKASGLKDRSYPLILRIHRGFFLTLGVHGWHRFSDAIQLLVDNPGLVDEWMKIYADFSIRLAERILSAVEVDAVLFSEPIGGNHGPLISPKMYATIILSSYQPILENLRRFGIGTFIYRTYANTRVLLPSVVKAGFNCLWACESDPKDMDYLDVRREFGKELRLIGGIDSDSLRQGQLDIQKSVLSTVPLLLEEGGYIPLADGRVRDDVSYENYVFYRKLLESVTTNPSIHQ